MDSLIALDALWMISIVLYFSYNFKCRYFSKKYTGKWQVVSMVTAT